MNLISATEFSCRNCGHSGHFYQAFHGYQVSDIANCARCNQSLDVSNARGIEKWKQKHSFSITNRSAKKLIVRIGGSKYEILSGKSINVTHRGNELFEYLEADNQWAHWSSVWYRYYLDGNSMDLSNFAFHSQQENTKSKNSWW